MTLMPAASDRNPGPGLRGVAVLSLFSLLAAGSSPGDQEKAPRRPPEPFRVFVYFIETADAGLKARLEEALPMVRERVERRRNWFRLAESRETADIMLRITYYRQGHPKDPPVRGGRATSMSDCWATEYHSVDAVVVAGDLRVRLSGLDHRCIDVGPSLRSAAGQLAEELERFAKDNYGALAQPRIRERERRDGEAPPPARNASPQTP